MTPRSPRSTPPRPLQPWTQQLKLLAYRLRAVLERHPGVAALLKTRDPLGPHSLALAEAFLAPLQAAGFGDHQAGLAFFLLVDYTIGLAVSSPHRRQRAARPRRGDENPTARVLPLAPDRFPALVALGEHVWLDNRDQRFTAGLDVLGDGLEHARRSPTDRRSEDDRPPLSDHVKRHGRRWMNRLGSVTWPEDLMRNRACDLGWLAWKAASMADPPRASQGGAVWTADPLVAACHTGRRATRLLRRRGAADGLRSPGSGDAHPGCGCSTACPPWPTG